MCNVYYNTIFNLCGYTHKPPSVKETQTPIPNQSDKHAPTHPYTHIHPYTHTYRERMNNVIIWK